MPWPNTRDYVEALRDTGLCFADDDLIDSVVDCNHEGLPLAITGNAASIFRVVKDDKAWAVKCFHWHQDHFLRYKAIEKALEALNSRYFCKFEYIKQGVKALGAWYPIVKMEWIEGETLENYILSNIQFPARIANVKKDFKDFLATMAGAGLAHMDLQHGNILVHMDRIRLVDYDVFYVDTLAELESLELGHHNYQHPRRLKRDYGAHMDNFSAWVIFASLHCLSLDTSLWHKLAGGDECLLFRQEDFGNPFNSYAFSLLESSAHAEVRNTSKLLRSFCEKPLSEIPTISEHLTTPIDLAPLPAISTVPVWIKAREEKNNPKAEGSAAPTTSRGFSYGTFRDFNEAVKDASNFEDRELLNSFCYLEDTAVGKNSRVYHFVGEDREIALKCFLHHVPEREQHYEAIKNALKGGIRPYGAQVHYLSRGIKINGQWCPALKMDWLKGRTINQLRATRVNEATASFLADRFADLVKTMRLQGIAHGDLSFDNLMVVDNDLKIVDYDAMYVPELARSQSLESGTPAFQHPQRSLKYFGPYLDNFSAWIIHRLLKNLPTRPDLIDIVDACLKDEGQTAVLKSALRTMETNREPEVREMGQLLRLLLAHGVAATPYLDPDRGFEKSLKTTTEVVKERTTSPFLKRKPKP